MNWKLNAEILFPRWSAIKMTTVEHTTKQLSNYILTRKEMPTILDGMNTDDKIC